MQKTFLILLILGFLVMAVPASAKISESNFLAAISKLVQDIMPQEEIFSESFDEDFIDPREVQQALREIKDQKRELNRIVKQAKKLANGGEIVNEINALLEQTVGFENKINGGVDLRDNIQEFRDAQIWEELNKIRAKVEIPKEIIQWNKEIKKLEKMLGQKKYQSLGLDLEVAKNKLAEVKDTLARVQEFYNSGDYESAMEEFNDLRQDLYIGEISNIIQRTQELMTRLKAVKNIEIKTQIQEAFSEVISNFNEGEYRVARELMDESWNDIMRTINQALTVGKKKGVSKENFTQMTDKLEEQMKNRAEEKKMKMEEVRVQKEEKMQPAQPVQTIQPAPEITQPVQ